MSTSNWLESVTEIKTADEQPYKDECEFVREVLADESKQAVVLAKPLGVRGLVLDHGDSALLGDYIAHTMTSKSSVNIVFFAAGKRSAASMIDRVTQTLRVNATHVDRVVLPNKSTLVCSTRTTLRATTMRHVDVAVFGFVYYRNLELMYSLLPRTRVVAGWVDHYMVDVIRRRVCTVPVSIVNRMTLIDARTVERFHKVEVVTNS